MKKIVILGNSIAAIKAMELIKLQAMEVQVTLLPLDDHLIVDKQRYVEMVYKQLKPKQIYYKTKDFYESQNIKIINDKKVTRVNVSRKKIHFEDRSQIDFEILILCDTPDHRFEEIKGTNKAGVFGFRKVKDLEQICTLAALNDTVAIEGDQWWTLELALLLAFKKKEVIFSISNNHPLVQGTSDEYRHWLSTTFLEKGISLLINNPITEILGESDLKAVRVRSGKVYATELVILEKTRLDTRVFSEALDISQESIVVDERYQSNIEGVFAIDGAALRSHELWGHYGPKNEFLEFQSRILASVLMGREENYELPIPFMAIRSEEFLLFSIGQVAERRGVKSSYKFDSRQGRFIRIFEKEDRVLGIITLNLEVEPEQLIRLIMEKKGIEAFPETLFSAFDPILNSPQNDGVTEVAHHSAEDILEQPKSV